MMRILVAGDFCEINRVADLIKSGDIENLFPDEVRDVIRRSDYSIVNFEFPIVVAGNRAIMKCGPNLQGTPQSIDAIKFAGFNCATLANNHILDYGPEALLNTRQLIEKSGLDTVGAGNNLEEAEKILYRTINGKVLAIINCCEHEFSIATASTPGANPLNPVQQYYSILEAKKNADYILVIVHGGHEHWQLPSPRMVETYRFLIEVGADAVVNHHQHCYSGYEVYKGKPIFYGTGNFCFDDLTKRSGIWTEGYMVTIDFSKEGPSFEIIPYKQCAEKPKVELLSRDTFNTQINKLNSIIADSSKLQEEVNRYYASCALQYSNVIEPVQNRFYLAAKRRGWLPSFISKRRRIQTENYINCEAHRDKLLWWLNNERIKNK